MSIEIEICSVKQSLIGLHKELMSLSAMRTRTRDCDQQIYVSSSGQRFLYSVPNGVFHLLTSFTHLEEFGRLHQMMQSSKQCKAHCAGYLRQDAHQQEPLLNTFTSIKALRWTLFVRNIDARDWELHLRYPESTGNETEYFCYGDGFIQACKAEELDIVKAVVERTRMDLEAKDARDLTPLQWAARKGLLAAVQNLCEHGACSDVSDVSEKSGWTPLHYAAYHDHLPAVQYLCEQGADKEARDRRDRSRLLWAAYHGRLPGGCTSSGYGGIDGMMG